MLFVITGFDRHIALETSELGRTFTVMLAAPSVVNVEIGSILEFKIGKVGCPVFDTCGSVFTIKRIVASTATCLGVGQRQA